MDRSFLRVFAFFTSGIAACVTLSAQWVDYPTPGIPRTADGKPNLKAPVPKMADGKPDLSGIWEVARNDKLRPAVFDIGARVPGGLPLRPQYAELVKQRAPFDSPLRAAEPKANCLPLGLVLDLYDGLNKFVQSPGLLIVMKEYNKSYRQIFLDGRPFPQDPDPSWDGYSVGHWDGDTLVVETIGLNGKSWLDIHGNPITDAAKVTERYHRTDFGHMTMQITVDDPKAYTKPWTLTLEKVLKTDTELLDYICAENEKDVKHIKGANDAGKNAK